MIARIAFGVVLAVVTTAAMVGAMHILAEIDFALATANQSRQFQE